MKLHVVKYVNGLLSKYETYDEFNQQRTVCVFLSTCQFKHDSTAVQMDIEMKKKNNFTWSKCNGTLLRR